MKVGDKEVGGKEVGGKKIGSEEVGRFPIDFAKASLWYSARFNKKCFNTYFLKLYLSEPVKLVNIVTRWMAQNVCGRAAWRSLGHLITTARQITRPLLPRFPLSR